MAWTKADYLVPGPGARGSGAHRTWLPWISVDHLHGITDLEEFDKTLYL